MVALKSIHCSTTSTREPNIIPINIDPSRTPVVFNAKYGEDKRKPQIINAINVGSMNNVNP